MKNKILILCALLLIGPSCLNGQDKINNLKTFAKVCGYVKYFHPSNEAASIDWNKFSAYGAEKILQCKDQTEVINTLNQLFQPIGPGITFSSAKQDYDLSSITPQSIDGYRPTYWQHLGVSTAEMLYQYHPQLPYKSVRVNQMREINEASHYGMLQRRINVEKYKSKEIKYTGWAKLKPGSTGTGHLWTRIYNSDNSEGFFANMDANPITGTEWEQFEIIGEADDLSSMVTFGGYLLGEGTLFLDGAELFYKENNEWKEIPFKNSDFEDIPAGVLTDESEWSSTGKGYSFQVSNTENKAGENCAVITGHIIKLGTMQII